MTALMEAQYEILKRQAELTDTARLLRIADILSQTESRMRYALSKRTLLETALIRCSRAAVVVSLEDILEKINDLRRAGHGDAATRGRGDVGKRDDGRQDELKKNVKCEEKRETGFGNDAPHRSGAPRCCGAAKRRHGEAATRGSGDTESEHPTSNADGRDTLHSSRDTSED